MDAEHTGMLIPAGIPIRTNTINGGTNHNQITCIPPVANVKISKAVKSGFLNTSTS